jgi:membrane fusion protein, heavy metal efflux system
MRRSVVIIGASLFGVAVVAAAATTALVLWRAGAPAVRAGQPVPAERKGEPVSGALLVGPDTLELPADVAAALGVRAEQARKAEKPRQLPPLVGSLAFDPNTLVRVHSRFPGEVVEIGPVTGLEGFTTPTQQRPLRFLDRVRKGDLLAVVWSKDLGEKKSELVDAVSQQRLDQETLKRLQTALDRGAVPERSLREAERNLEADNIAVARAERTLRAWRLTPEEIQQVRDEAERLRTNQGRDRKLEEGWARVEIRASQDGTLLEKNVSPGDLVDTTTDLFKVADLTRLAVWAHVYEEDLPALHDLPQPLSWTVRLKAKPDGPPYRGTVSSVGQVIDPNQHTALVSGEVDNAQGELRVGQFITATIDLPASPDEVEVAPSALLEDGRSSCVFVQPDPAQPVFVRRPVQVVRRLHDVIYVRSRLPEGPREDGVTELRAGERVVVSGAVELQSALDDLQRSIAP